MIKKAHPIDREERRKLKVIHEKTERFRKKARQALRDQETQDELQRGKSAPSLDGEHQILD